MLFRKQIQIPEFTPTDDRGFKSSLTKRQFNQGQIDFQINVAVRMEAPCADCSARGQHHQIPGSPQPSTTPLTIKLNSFPFYHLSNIVARQQFEFVVSRKTFPLLQKLATLLHSAVCLKSLPRGRLRSKCSRNSKKNEEI